MIEALRAVVEAMPENKTRATDLRMSLAGDCPRKLEYDFMDGAGPITLEFWLKMESGKLIHEFLQALFVKVYGKDFHSMEEEVSLKLGDLDLKGHPDGILESLHDKAVVEIKSVSDATFTKISNENKPLDQHIEQANLYAFALKLPTCIIFYLNRESCELKVFIFDRSDDMAVTTMEKFQRVVKNRLAVQVGDRPYSDKTESPCWYCHHKDKCYEGFRNEVEGGRSAHVEDALAYTLADGAWKARAQRLEADKVETKLKTELGKMIHSMGLNRASVPKYSIELKVGKNDNLLTNIKEQV